MITSNQPVHQHLLENVVGFSASCRVLCSERPPWSRPRMRAAHTIEGGREGDMSCFCMADNTILSTTTNHLSTVVYAKNLVLCQAPDFAEIRPKGALRTGATLACDLH